MACPRALQYISKLTISLLSCSAVRSSGSPPLPSEQDPADDLDTLEIRRRFLYNDESSDDESQPTSLAFPEPVEAEEYMIVEPPPPPPFAEPPPPPPPAATSPDERSPPPTHPPTRQFPVHPKRRQPTDVYKTAHDRWFVRLYMVVIAFIHYTFHLPFIACNLLLFTFAAVLRAVGALRMDEFVPITLGTVLKRLDIEDRFATLPLCPSCHKIFIDPVDDPATFVCPKCDEPVFQSATHRFPEVLADNLAWMRAKRAKPRKVVAFRSVSSMISEFLETEGMVEKMDAWRTKDRCGDRLQDIMDGRVWGDLKDPSGQAFFRPGVEEELRIGVTVNLDWYVLRRMFLTTLPY